jgi:hypothetical protein
MISSENAKFRLASGLCFLDWKVTAYASGCLPAALQNRPGAKLRCVMSTQNAKNWHRLNHSAQTCAMQDQTCTEIGAKCNHMPRADCTAEGAKLEYGHGNEGGARKRTVLQSSPESQPTRVLAPGSCRDGYWHHCF